MPETIAAGFVNTISGTRATVVSIDATVAAAAASGAGTVLDVSALPSWPALTVEISFTQTVDDEPVWTDVTDYVQVVSTRTGRSYELDRPETGSFTVELENRDRRFEPGYQGSPYWPNVTPGREIRVRATWLGTVYDLARGRIEAWPVRWGVGADVIVSVTAVDGFELLARNDVVSVEAPKEWTGQRIARLLDAAGWPADRRALDLGLSYVQPQTLEGVNVLEKVLAVADTELGFVFVDGAGRVRFLDRSVRSAVASATFTLGDDEDEISELPYDDAPLEYGLDKVFTEVPVTRDGGFQQRAVSADALLEQQGRRVMPARTGLWTADVVALAVAEYLLERHEEPRIRFTSAVLDPVPHPSLWPAVLGGQIGDVVRVNRRPAGGGSATVQDCLIEGIAHGFGMDRRWRTVWQLAAAFPSTVTIPADGIDVPVNTSPPRVSGQTVVGQTLKITTLGRWYDERQATITFAYRWQTATPTTFVDPETGDEQTVPADGTIADIPGAAAFTYTISGTFEGKLIRAVVDGQNPAGTGTGYSTWDGPVTLEPPPPTDEPPTTDDGGGGDGGGDTGGTHPFELDVDSLDDPDALLA